MQGSIKERLLPWPDARYGTFQTRLRLDPHCREHLLPTRSVPSLFALEHFKRPTYHQTARYLTVFACTVQPLNSYGRHVNHSPIP